MSSTKIKSEVATKLKNIYGLTHQNIQALEKMAPTMVKQLNAYNGNFETITTGLGAYYSHSKQLISKRRVGALHPH